MREARESGRCAPRASQADVLTTPYQALLLVLRSDDVGHLLVVEEDEPDQFVCAIVIDEARNIRLLHRLDIAQTPMDELRSGCHLLEQGVRRLVGLSQSASKQESSGNEVLHDELLLAAVAVNQVVHSVGWHLALLIEELGVIRQGQVRDVLPELPVVGRPEELSGTHLMVDEVAVAQGLHIVLSATLRGNVVNKTPVRESPFSTENHSGLHMTSIS